MMYKHFRFIFTSVFLSIILSCCDTSKTSTESKTSSKLASESINVLNPYIRAMPPGQTVTAMFLTLNNNSAIKHSLIGAESDVSKTLELHQHKQIDGIMQMGQIEQIDILPNNATTLAPSGYHIMLIGLKKDLEQGQKVNVKLTFKDGSHINVQSEVKKIAVN